MRRSTHHIRPFPVLPVAQWRRLIDRTDDLPVVSGAAAAFRSHGGSGDTVTRRARDTEFGSTQNCGPVASALRYDTEFGATTES